MMKALGIIFSNIHNETIDELTRKRTSASIPFGGRYRLIDFALSNLVNADVVNVGILAQKNYQSLMDHLGSGKDWDLSRKNGGLVVFPPFGSYKSDILYSSRLEALVSIRGYIEKAKEEMVVLMDCDSANVIDLSDVFEFHQTHQADMTLLYRHGKCDSDLVSNMDFTMNEEGRIIKADLKSKRGKITNTFMNVCVINRRLLQGLLEDAISQGLESFHRDIIFGNIKSLKIYGYAHQGIYLHVNTMENYFKCSMSLLDKETREALFGVKNHRVYTKVRDSSPTRYGFHATIENSFIADGCEIEGTVINSILFRGVKVGKGTIVKNSILMQDTITGNNVALNYVVTDKNVTIRDRNHLAGCEKIPYYLGKNTMV
ncbi:MAG: glucose-1-phosphate adenylyltransferase subunit GlgD [Prevotella sp.]|nr:glucose-1-phosphate adenylyltransferase subunit GlgD [Prevotella sp.]